MSDKTCPEMANRKTCAEKVTEKEEEEVEEEGVGEEGVGEESDNREEDAESEDERKGGIFPRKDYTEKFFRRGYSGYHLYRAEVVKISTAQLVLTAEAPFPNLAEFLRTRIIPPALLPFAGDLVQQRSSAAFLRLSDEIDATTRADALKRRNGEGFNIKTPWFTPEIGETSWGIIVDPRKVEQALEMAYTSEANFSADDKKQLTRYEGQFYDLLSTQEDLQEELYQAIVDEEPDVYARKLRKLVRLQQKLIGVLPIKNLSPKFHKYVAAAHYLTRAEETIAQVLEDAGAGLLPPITSDSAELDKTYVGAFYAAYAADWHLREAAKLSLVGQQIGAAEHDLGKLVLSF